VKLCELANYITAYHYVVLYCMRLTYSPILTILTFDLLAV